MQEIEGEERLIRRDVGQPDDGFHGCGGGFVHEHIDMQIPAPIVAEAQLRVIKRELYVRCELLLHLPDKRSLVCIHAHPVHAQSLFLKLFEGGEERLRIVGRVGQDQTAVFFASDRERSVPRELCRVHGRAAVFLFGQEAVDGENVVVDVRL